MAERDTTREQTIRRIRLQQALVEKMVSLPSGSGAAALDAVDIPRLKTRYANQEAALNARLARATIEQMETLAEAFGIIIEENRDFAGPDLLPEQLSLLKALVQAYQRWLPKRESFLALRTLSNPRISHPGLTENLPVHLPDLDALAGLGYVTFSGTARMGFDLTVKGLDRGKSGSSNVGGLEVSNEQPELVPAPPQSPPLAFVDLAQREPLRLRLATLRDEFEQWESSGNPFEPVIIQHLVIPALELALIALNSAESGAGAWHRSREALIAVWDRLASSKALAGASNIAGLIDLLEKGFSLLGPLF